MKTLFILTLSALLISCCKEEVELVFPECNCGFKYYEEGSWNGSWIYQYEKPPEIGPCPPEETEYMAFGKKVWFCVD